MAKTKTATRKRKPIWQLSRRGVYGGIALIIAACAWTFFLGVLVGRGTAPVTFDMEKLGQDLHALRENVQQQQARQLEAYSDAIENKSELDFYEELKQPGDKLEIDPDLRRKPPQPTIQRSPSLHKSPQNQPSTAKLPVKRRMAGLQPKKNRVAQRSVPKPPSATPQGAGDATGNLTLQVASLRDAKMADDMVARLRKEGYSVSRKSATIPGQGTWYRVQVGRYRDREQATKTMRALESKGLKPILVSR